MHLKTLLTLSIISAFTICLITFSSSGTAGAIRGLNLCYSAVIPSLFPFMVCTLMLFESNALSQLSGTVNKLFGCRIKFNENIISIFLLSLIGGYPVGAKLINNAVENRQLSDASARILLRFCVNSGPSFIIITIGSTLLSSIKIGYILFLSNTVASLLVALFSCRKLSKNKYVTHKQRTSKPFSEVFVSATYDAASTIIQICAFVVLFSCISGIISNNIHSIIVKDTVVSLLEITSGIAYCQRNVLTISFLLGFAGISVHFQILSMCKSVKINYLEFLIFRLLHGLVSALLTFIIIKIFKITIPTVSLSTYLCISPTKYSPIFSIALITLSVLFILSVKRKNKII